MVAARAISDFPTPSPHVVKLETSRHRVGRLQEKELFRRHPVINSSTLGRSGRLEDLPRTRSCACSITAIDSSMARARPTGSGGPLLRHLRPAYRMARTRGIGCLYGGKIHLPAGVGNSTSAVDVGDEEPVWQNHCGKTGPGILANAIGDQIDCQNASCASHDQPMIQPIPRVESASVCSERIAGGIERTVGESSSAPACGCLRWGIKFRRGDTASDSGTAVNARHR